MNPARDPVPCRSHQGLYRAAVHLAVGALVVWVVGFAVSLRVIFRGVKTTCEAAQGRYPGDHVEALMSLAGSEQATFIERNRAVWALGQIGDRRALPLLRQLDTDEVQPKPLDASKYIVQYSVEKAIRQIEGGFSLTRWMYRWSG